MKNTTAIDLNIIKANKSDAKEIIEYINTVGGESDNLLFGANEFHMTVKEEENYIENLSNTSALFIGRLSDEIVCIGNLSSPPRERISHQVNLSLSVKKKYWNQGIGTQLLQHMINFTKENKQTEIIHLGVKEDNTNAIRLYETLGFEKIGLYKNYFKINGNYFDEILMNLYI